MKLKAKDLREKSKEELIFLLNEERARLLNLRLKGKIAQQKNVKEEKEIKKNIARILTIFK